jgi:Fe-S-cluster containining protein
MKRDQPDFVAKLCPNCGLCCDGTLFADVELRAGDNAKRLAKLGLPPRKNAGGRLAFAQPCACFDGTLCGIYGERPVRCRSFECGLLKRVQAGEMPPEMALKKISAAKRRIAKVRRLLPAPGQLEEKLALVQRYTQAMSTPINLAEGLTSGSLRGKLLLAYDDLMQTLRRDFLE